MAHIIVVGGGILGMLTARELSQAKYQVTLIEKGELGQESSWAGGGILSPLYPWRYPDSINVLASWSQAAYPDLCESLRRETCLDPEYTQNGMLIIIEHEQTKATSWAQQHHRQLSLISATESAQLEPALAKSVPCAIWMPTVGQVRNPRLAKALAVDIDQRDVNIFKGRSVTDLTFNHGKVNGVHTETGRIDADAVIVCAGAWTARVLKSYLPTPEIRPVRGQMLLFKTEPGLIKRIVLEENRYVIPRRDGHVLFGSTLEEAGFDKSTTQAARNELHALATERFPALRNYPVVKHWAGLRPASPGGIPYIGAHPSFEGLYINAGHFRNGVVLGPASARLMANIVAGASTIVPPEPYSLGAFREENTGHLDPGGD
jgi:glycine oxidase